MQKEVARNEQLFKVVKGNNPNLWDDEYNRPTSALFKDSKGSSVDRDGGRTDDKVTDTLINRFGEQNVRAVVSLNAGFCLDLPTFLKPEPTEDNEFHAEIHESEECVTIQKSKLRKMSMNCKITHLHKQHE